MTDLSASLKRRYDILLILAHILPSLLLALLLLLLHLLLRNAMRLRHSLQQHQHHLLVHHILLQPLTDQLLHLLQIHRVVPTPHPNHASSLCDEAVRIARPSRTRRSSHAVDVVLAVGREVVVDDHVHARHVQTTRRHVRGDQNVARALLELGES